jgi:hypothetical protein
LQPRYELLQSSVLDMIQTKVGLEGDTELFAFLLQLTKQIPKNDSIASSWEVTQQDLINFVQFVLSDGSLSWSLLLFKLMIELFTNEHLLKSDGTNCSDLQHLFLELEKSQMLDEQDIQELLNIFKQKEHHKSFESIPRIHLLSGASSKCIKYEVTGKSTGIVTGYKIIPTIRDFSYYEVHFKEMEPKLKGFRFGWTSSTTNLNDSVNLGDNDSTWVYDGETRKFLHAVSNKAHTEVKPQPQDSAKLAFSEQLARSLSAKSFDLDQDQEENLMGSLFFDEPDSVPNQAESKIDAGSNESLFESSEKQQSARSTDTIQSPQDQKGPLDSGCELSGGMLDQSEILKCTTFGAVVIHETGNLLFYADGQFLGTASISIDLANYPLEVLSPVFTIGVNSKAELNVGTHPFRFAHAVAKDIATRFQQFSEKSSSESVTMNQIKPSFISSYVSFEERLSKGEENAESACVLVQNVYSDALKTFTFEFSANAKQVSKEQIIFCCSPVLSGVIMNGKELEEQSCKIGFDNQLCLFIEIFGCERVKTSTLNISGSWHHFAVAYTFHRSTGKANLLFVLDGNAIFSHEIANTRSNKPGKVYPRQVSIGGPIQNNENGFYGELCDVRLWSTARSVDRLLSVLGRSQVLGTESDLILFLPFDESRGNIIKDYCCSKSSSRKSEILTLRGHFHWGIFSLDTSPSDTLQNAFINTRNISSQANTISQQLGKDPSAPLAYRIYRGLIRRLLISTEKYLFQKTPFSGFRKTQTKLPSSSAILCEGSSSFLLLKSLIFSLIQYKETCHHCLDEVFFAGSLTLLNLLESNILALQFAPSESDIDSDTKASLLVALLYFFREGESVQWTQLKTRSQQLLQQNLNFFFPDVWSMMRLFLLLMQLENKSGAAITSSSLRRAVSNSTEDKSVFYCRSPISDIVPVILATGKSGRTTLLEILCLELAKPHYLNQLIISELRPMKVDPLKGTIILGKQLEKVSGLRKPYIGGIVKRGPDWTYADEDGGDGNTGIILKMDKWNNDPDKGIVVSWKNGLVDKYRFGVVDFAGKKHYDIEVLTGSDLGLNDKKMPESPLEKKNLVYTPSEVYKALLNNQETDIISKRSILTYMKEIAALEWLEHRDLLKPFNTLTAKLQAADVCNLYRDFYSTYSSKTDKHQPLTFMNAFSSALASNPVSLLTDFANEAFLFIAQSDSSLSQNILKVIGSVQVLLFTDIDLIDQSNSSVNIDFEDKDMFSEIGSLGLNWDLGSGTLFPLEGADNKQKEGKNVASLNVQYMSTFSFGKHMINNENIQIRNRSRCVELTLSGDREWNTAFCDSGFEPESGVFKWYVRPKFSERRSHFLLGLSTEDCNCEEFLGQDKNTWGISQNLDFFHAGKKQSFSTTSETRKISSGSILELTFDSHRGAFGLVEFLPDSVTVLIEMEKCLLEDISQRKVFPAFSMFTHGDVISIITDVNEINACKMKSQFLQTTFTSTIKSSNVMYAGTPNDLVIEFSLTALRTVESLLAKEVSIDLAPLEKQLYSLTSHLLAALCRWTCPPLYKMEVLKQSITKILELLQSRTLSTEVHSPAYSHFHYMNSLLILVISKIVEAQMHAHRFVFLHDVPLKPGDTPIHNTSLCEWVSTSFFKNGYKSSQLVENWVRFVHQKESRIELFFRWLMCFDRTHINVRKIGGDQMNNSVKLVCTATLYHSGLLGIANKLKDSLFDTINKLGKLEGTLEEYFVKNIKPPAFLQTVWESAMKLKAWAKDEIAIDDSITYEQLSSRVYERSAFLTKFLQSSEDVSVLFNSVDVIPCINQCNTELRGQEQVISEISTGIKKFLVDKISTELLDRYSKLISHAAMDRAASMRLVQGTFGSLGSTGNFVKTLFLDAVTPVLRGTQMNWTLGTLIPSKNNQGWHYTNDLDGSSLLTRNEVKGSFHSMFSVFVSDLGLSNEADFYKLSLLNVLATRISDYDHELLVRVNFFFVLKDQLDESLNAESKSDVIEKIILIIMKLLILMASQIAFSNTESELSFKASHNQLRKVRSGPSTLSDAVFDTLYKLLKEWSLRHISEPGFVDPADRFRMKIQTISTESATLLQCISGNEKCQQILCRREWLDLLLELIFFSDPLCRLKSILILSDCLSSIQESEIRMSSFGCLAKLHLESHSAFASLPSSEVIIQLLLYLIGSMLTTVRGNLLSGFYLYGIITEASALIRKLFRGPWKKSIEARFLKNFQQCLSSADIVLSQIITGTLAVLAGGLEIPYLYSPVLVHSKSPSYIGIIKAVNEEADKFEILACRLPQFSQQIELTSAAEEPELFVLGPGSFIPLHRESMEAINYSEEFLKGLCDVWNSTFSAISELSFPKTFSRMSLAEEKNEDMIIESKTDEAEKSPPNFTRSLQGFLICRVICEILSSPSTNTNQTSLIMSNIGLDFVLSAANKLTNSVGIMDIPFYVEHFAASLFSMLRPLKKSQISSKAPSPVPLLQKQKESQNLSRSSSSKRLPERPPEPKEEEQMGGGMDPELIDSLAAMGFPRKVCALALQLCGGDPAEALNYILANGSSIVEMLAASGNDVEGEENEDEHGQPESDYQQNESEWVLPKEEKVPDEEPDEDEEEHEDSRELKADGIPTAFHCTGTAKKFLPFYIEPNFESERLGCVFPGDDLGVLEEKIDGENVWYKLSFSDFDSNNYHSTYGDEIYEIFIWVPKFVDGVEMVKPGSYDGDGDNDLVEPQGDSFKIDRYYRIIGSNGALVRDGQEISTNEVASLNIGDIVHACEESFNSEGTIRLKLDSPVRGWISKIFGLVERVSGEVVANLLGKSDKTAPVAVELPINDIVASEMDALEKIEDNLEVLTGYDIYARDDRFFGNRQGIEYKFFSSDENKFAQQSAQRRSRIAGSKTIFQYFKYSYTTTWFEIGKCLDHLLTLYSRKILVAYFCRISISARLVQAFLLKLNNSPAFSAEYLVRFLRLSVFRGDNDSQLELLCQSKFLQEVQISPDTFIEGCMDGFLTTILHGTTVSDSFRQSTLTILLNSTAKNLTMACDTRYADHSWTESTFDEDSDEDVFNLPNVQYAQWATNILMRTQDVSVAKKLIYIWIRTLRGSSMSLKTIVFKCLAEIVCKLRDLSVGCDEMLAYFSEIIPVKRLSRFASKRLWQEMEDYPAFSRFVQSVVSFVSEIQITMRVWQTHSKIQLPLTSVNEEPSGSRQAIKFDQRDSYIQLFPAKDIPGSWTLEITIERKRLIAKQFTPGTHPYESQSSKSPRTLDSSRLSGEKPGLGKLLKMLLGTAKSPIVSEKAEAEKRNSVSITSIQDSKKSYLHPVFLLSSPKYFLKIQKGGRDFTDEGIQDPLNESEPVYSDAQSVSFGQFGGDEKTFDCTIPYDEWMTIYLVCDVSATSMSLYLNGKLADTQYGVIPLPIATIGSNKSDVSFAGDICNFKVWSYAKSAKEVMQQNIDACLINLKFDTGLNFGIFDGRGYLVTCKTRSCSAFEIPELPVLSPSTNQKTLPFLLPDELNNDLTGTVSFQGFGTAGQFVKGIREIVSLRYKSVSNNESIQVITGIFSWVEKNVQNYFVGEIRNQEITIELNGEDFYSGPPEKLNWLKRLKMKGLINSQNNLDLTCSALVLADPSMNLSVGTLKPMKKGISTEVVFTDGTRTGELTIELNKTASEGQYVVTFDVVSNVLTLQDGIKAVDLTQTGIFRDQGSYWADFTLKANGGSLAFGFCTPDALTHPDSSVDANDGAWTYSTSGPASHGADLHLCEGSEEGTTITLQINTNLGIIRIYRNYEILITFNSVMDDPVLKDSKSNSDNQSAIFPFVSLVNPGDCVHYNGLKEGPIKISFPADDVEERTKLYTSISKGCWNGYSLLTKKNDTEKWLGLWQYDLPVGIHVCVVDCSLAEVSFSGVISFENGQPSPINLSDLTPVQISDFTAEYNKLRQKHADLKYTTPVVPETVTTANPSNETMAATGNSAPPTLVEEIVNITFVDSSNESSVYQVEKEKPLGQIFSSYALKRDASAKSFLFKFNGSIIADNATVLSANIPENATIEVSTKSFTIPIVEFGDPTETYFPDSDAPYVIMIVYEAGATVRNGVEIEESLALRTLKQGEVVEAYLKSFTNEGIGRFKIADGWVSEKLRGGSEAAVALTLMEKFDAPKKYRVIRNEGAKIRASASFANSAEVGICPTDTVLTVTERRIVQSIEADSPHTPRLKISEPVEWQGWISEKTHLLEEIKDNVDPDITLELRRRNKIRQTRQLKRTHNSNELKTEPIYAWVNGNVSLSKETFFLLRRSKNTEGISFSEDFTTVTSPDSSGGRSLVLGSKGFSHGVHYWEVQVNNASWGSVFIGVAPEDSLGWNGFGFINYRAVQSFGSETLYGSYFGVGDKIGVLLDMDRGTLTFFKDGEDFNLGRVTVINMGIAYHNVRKLSTRYTSTSTLFPCFGMKSTGDQLTINNCHWISEEGLNATNYLEKLINCWEFLSNWKLSYSQPEYFANYLSRKSSEESSEGSLGTSIQQELYKQYQEKIADNEFYIESRPGISVKVNSSIERFYEILTEEFVKEFNIFAGVIMNTVYGKGMILGISGDRIWYSCERNFRKAWYWLAPEFKQLLQTGLLTISYLDPTTMEFQTIPMLSKPSFPAVSREEMTEDQKSGELSSNQNEFYDILHLSQTEFDETLTSFFHSDDAKRRKWAFEDDISLITFINQVSLILDVNSSHLTINNILFYYYSHVSSSKTGNKYTLLFQKFAIKEVIVRYLLLNYCNSSVATILPLIDLSSSDSSTTLTKIQSSLLSSDNHNHTRGQSSFAIASNMKNLISEFKSLIYPSIKMNFWQTTVVETTVPTSAPPDEYERPDEIREVSINRIQARDVIRRKDDLSFPEKLKFSVFGQLLENFNHWDSRSFRRSYAHMQDAGQPRAFFVRFIGEGVDDQGGPYRAVFQSSIGEEINENLLSLLVECSNAKDEIGENRDKFQFHNNSSEFEDLTTKLFIHLGKMIGIACRHKILLPLPLIPSIWKSLVQNTINSHDLFAVDRSLMNSLQQIPNYLQEMAPESIYDLLVQALLNCNTSEELKILPLQAKKVVLSAMKKEGIQVVLSSPTSEDHHHHKKSEEISLLSKEKNEEDSDNEDSNNYGIQEVIELIQYYRLSSQNRLLQYFFEGLSYVLPVEVLSIFTPEEAERLFCGENTVDLEVLKKATEYESVTPNDV